MISKKGYQPEGTEEVFVVSCVVPEIVYTYRVKSQLCWKLSIPTSLEPYQNPPRP